MAILCSTYLSICKGFANKVVAVYAINWQTYFNICCFCMDAMAAKLGFYLQDLSLQALLSKSYSYFPYSVNSTRKEHIEASLSGIS